MKFLPLRILAVAGFLALLLVGLVISENRARDAGQEVTLAMEAVDPRSLLTGHYIDLDLTQRMPPGRPCPTDLVNRGRQGWLALKPAGDRHVLAGSGDTREDAGKFGAVLVKGNAWCRDLGDVGGQAQAAVSLEIGVDRFHTAQVDAERMERELRARIVGQPAQAFAIVSVGQDGRARLKAVIIEGKRMDLDWW